MVSIKNEWLNFEFLETGALYQAKVKDKNINLFKGNYIDGSYSNIYLKVFDQDQEFVAPLFGKNANSKFFSTGENARWVGEFQNIGYEVQFHLVENIFCYQVKLSGKGTCTLYFCNDLSLGYEGNEAYIGQYIDHRVLCNKDSYTVISRQNQSQKGKFPRIQLGGTETIEGFSTDGFQFYGRSYKVTNRIKGLYDENLENKIYQYEFPLIALKTSVFNVENAYETTFYGCVSEDSAPNEENLLPEANIPKYTADVSTQDWKAHTPIAYQLDMNCIVEAKSIPELQLEKVYPQMEQKEYKDGQLLSFFCGEKHIVLREKELHVERQHGNILLSTQDTFISENKISTTCYMSGVFNSHMVIGNTNMNIFLSFIRNPLNIGKINGQRILVKLKGKYQLLAEPSLFEMGLNYCKWIYVLEEDTIVVTTATKTGTPVVQLQLKSEQNKSYDFVITNLLAMGTDENQSIGEIDVHKNEYAFSFHPETPCHKQYPNMKYMIHMNDQAATFGGDEIFYEDGKTRIHNLKCIKVENSPAFTMSLSGSIDGTTPCAPFSLEEEIMNYKEYYDHLINGFHLSNEQNPSTEFDKFNKIVYWYAHNALVHYTMPHGLEQYSGAAWGTRDVCQGPFEFFLAIQNYQECREILKKVYSYQIAEDGTWSQWFMFDRYQYLQMGESHGDVIVWPAKALSMYILATGDYEILQEKVPYVIKKQHYDFTEDVYTIGQHLEKQLAYIVDNFYPNTCLSKYGGGDWDDTLQPYRAELRDQMISGWTTSLTFEVFDNLQKVFDSMDPKKSQELKIMKEQLLEDYNRFIIQDGVTAGFISFSETGETQCILHPSDDQTNIQYRLLPMTRSIIGKLFTKEQAEKHIKIIEDHLYYADGVRLMSDSPTYRGGLHTYFLRAESATNFGREIGLNYIHADIRYAEAMAVFGNGDEAVQTMLKINPVKIQDTVKNAELRQNNCYFSSSDADFYTRYEAMQDFYKLRCGDVSVKGGWRIYSSGPGIYIHQLISSILGIRFEDNDLIIDCALPEHYDGTSLNYKIYDKSVIFHYKIKKKGASIKTVLLDGKEIPMTRIENPYRMGGVKIQQKHLETVLKNDSIFEIIIC